MKRTLALALLFSTALGAPHALAAPEAKPSAAEAKANKVALDKARAQFQQGLALETAGDWAGALDLFQQVAQVKLTPQVRFHVGLCEEHLGRLSAALGDYELAAHEADEAKVAEVSAQVASRRDELRARIPQLTIARGRGGEYATVSLDGVTLGSSSIGLKLPVDPGPHSVEARAPGYQPFRASIDLAERDSKKIEVTLEPVPTPQVGSDPTAPSGPSGAIDTGSPSTSPLPYIVGGAGVASLAAGGVFFLLRQSAIHSLDDQCTLPPGRTCPESAQSTFDHGRTYNALMNVTLGVGVVGVGVGTALWLTRPKSPSSATLAIAPGTQGASLGATLAGFF